MQSTGPTSTQSPAPIQKTWMPVTAGILSIIAGAIGLLSGIGFMVLMPVYTQMMSQFGAFGFYERQLLGMMGLFGIPLVILGIVAIVGGIFAVRRRVWGMALAGAICSLMWPMTILGILSIIFVSISKKEFA